MYRSESITSNLLMEIDSLTNRISNIKESFRNTAHNGLRERLFYENKNISQRLNEIYSIAKFLKKRTIEKISFTSLLLEKSERTIAKARMEKNLFFL
tara:strand:+ start:173 stop:463 length:291 start_codon:yes stop_codon:yes gene_type:complete